MPRALHLVVCAASAACIAVLAVLFIFRVSYPYELEWLEGWMLDSVQQVLDGRALYGPPSLEFVGPVYNPVYLYVSAALAWPLGGVSFAVARMVSVLSVFGLFAVLILRLKPSDRAAGLIAAGLYAASYRFSGAWMDIARNDSLFLFVLTAAFLIGRDSKSWWQDLICGLGYSIAFFTKQTTLAVLAVLFLGQFLADRRRYWTQWISFAVVTAATFALLDWSSNGWYSYYTLDSPMHFVPHPDQFYFVGQARLKLLPGLLALVLAIAVVLARRWTRSLADDRDDGTPARFDAAGWSTAMFALGLVISSWAVFRQRGTFDNVFMPACLGVAVGAALAYHEFSAGVRRTNGEAALRADGRDWRLVGVGAVTILILQQFALLTYNPLRHVPSRADRDLGDQFIASVRALRGSVWIWAHGHYGQLAGKGRYLHDISFIDAAGRQSVPPRSEDNRWRRQLVRDTVANSVRQQDFDAIIIDRENDLWPPYYLPSARISEAPREFTGRDTRVGMVLSRNPVAEGGRLDATDPTLSWLFGEGWGAPQSSGRPLMGDGATVTIALARGNGYQLQAGLQVQCEKPAGAATVTIAWDDRVIGERRLAECGLHQMNVPIVADTIAHRSNTLRFAVKWEGTAAPLALSSITLVPLATPATTGASARK